MSVASLDSGGEAARHGAEPTVAVLLPLALAGTYDYLVPAALAVAPGDFVRVPLGRREAVGVVWGDASGDIARARLRPIAARLAIPALTAVQRRFVDWVAAYSLSSAGAVLRMAMSIPEALEPRAGPAVLRAVAGFAAAKPLSEARRRALEILAAREPIGAAALARAAGVSAAVVKGLVAQGAIAIEARAEAPPGVLADPDAATVQLSADQAVAAAALGAAARANEFSVTLLEGVTGSGKTEVYFEAIAETLRAGRQALVLLPEIALSAQWIERFSRRFGARPALWHSEVRRGERRAIWRGVIDGLVRVVVGARSALFLPFPDLGLIVVDEEHDGSFKQDDGVIYHARDMAVVRAHLGAIPAVLASATPAIETVANVARGRYRHATLPSRHGGAVLPAIGILDMRREALPAARWISPTLETALRETLSAGEQAMLFLNRRGYAPVTVCRHCGAKLSCPHCSAWLVEHRLASRLQCHHCGHGTALPEACPSCAARRSLVGCGPGVERLSEEAAALFPAARIAVVASDTLGGPGAVEAFVRRMRAREIDLLIGTQVVAKGHDFPLLTTVGVVDADLTLGGGDLRAAERTWQLLSQVAGRAGRGERPGRVLLQSYMPDHPVLQALASGDKPRFVAAEMAAREEAGYPPFGRLAAIIVSAPKRDLAEEAAAEIARKADRVEGIELFGPAPAPLAVLRGLHRFRLLAKARKDAPLQATLRRWLAASRHPAAVRIKVDVDPYGFL
jgi:primosomal protein N' (replication factor Y)